MKIYIPVPIAIEVPQHPGSYFLITEKMGGMTGRYYYGEWELLYADTGHSKIADDDKITHWLKEIDIPDAVTIKLHASEDNPYESSAGKAFSYHAYHAWTTGLVVGIRSVLKLIQ